MSTLDSALSGGSTPSGIDAIVSQATSAMAENERNYEARAKPIEEKLGGLVEKTKSAEPPKVPTLTPAPKPPEATPFEGFGSAASMMAIFGSLLTRHPLTSALNASAGVMNAYHQQDAAAFKQKMDEWKLNMENVDKLHNFEMDTYKATMEKYKGESGILETMLKNDAAMFKNETLAKMADLKMGAQYLKTMQANSDKAKKQSTIIQQFVQDKVDDYKSTHPDATQTELDQVALKSFGEANTTAKGATDPSITPETAKLAAEQYIVQGPSALTAYGRGAQATANLTAIHNEVTKIAKERGLSGEDIAKENAEFKGLIAEQSAMGRRAGQTAQGAAELEQLIPATRDSLHKLDLSRFPDYNKFKIYALKHTGDPDVAEAYANLQETQNAYTALLVRGGQRTDAAQAASEHLMDMAFSPGQSDRVLDTMSKNAGRIMTGIKNAKQGRIGNPPTEKEKKWLKDNDTPVNRASYDAHFGDGEADKLLGEE